MNIPLRARNKLRCNHESYSQRRLSGFTLIELMIVLVIVAIGIALAAPTYNSIVQKRELVSAAEGIHSFVVSAQQQAVKRNEPVTVSWYSPGSHSADWCIGVSVGATPCNCNSTPAQCVIDNAPYLLTQADFQRAGTQFFHAEPHDESKSFFIFDPIRGILDIDNTHDDVKDRIDADDWIFYVHSDTRDENDSGGSRWYALEMNLSYTGRFTICTDTSRQRVVGGYPPC